QILQIYFNEIPYGSTNYGVEAASQSYFGKHVSDLSLAESAVLAGFPKAPSRYLNNMDILKERRDFVLRRMFEEGYISEEEKDAAQAEPISLTRSFANLDDLNAPHFVTYVERQLNEQFGEHAVERGGLRVITTLDWDKQEIAEKAVADHAKLLEEAGGNNAALAAIDPKNGHVLAMVGSKKFSDESINGQFNVAVDGKRQPGSSFKPIIYAAAFEKGYTPETVLYDVLTNFAVSGKPYKPLNYDLKERGPVTMRQALQGSLNIPAVQTFYLVGQRQGIEFAKRLGYSTLNDGDFGLSLVLGGGEVKLLDHVSAYATFAERGVRHPPVSILSVETPEGDVLFETKKEKGEKILDEKVAALITNVLSDDEARAYVFGRGGVLTLPDRFVAAKTGTTDNYVDAWTIGYVPSLSAGVWAGNTDNTAMKAGYGGSRVAGQIWNQFMKEATKDTAPESFPAPPGNDAEKPILRGTGGGSVSVRLNRLTGRRAVSSTPEHLIIERTYALPHSILHYVNKDDPRGPDPIDPAGDPQYAIWEAAIHDWIERKKAEDPNWEISFEEPPTEFDDAYSAELLPTLEIVHPAPSSTLMSRDIRTDIRVSAPRGVAKVTYQLDGKFVGVITAHPFNLAYYARELLNGTHTLTVAVEDDIGNRRIEEITFLLQAGEEPPGVSWQESSVSLSQNDFPRTFFLNHFKLGEIQSVTIKKQKDGGDASVIAGITDFSQLFNNQISVKWDERPDTGNWALIAEVAAKDGSVRESGRMMVEVR
ncbi:MAG: penicillin-binding transpeptidase domain-containing protein, partial [Patescibacteria group bacterium]